MDTPTPPPSKPPPSTRAPTSARVAPAPPVGPPAGAATAAGDPPAAVVELHRSRSSSRRPSWLWVALPVGGLMIVPLFGLLYTGTTTFGKGPDEAATGSAAVDVEDDTTGAGVAGSKKTTRPAKKSSTSRRSTLRARTDSAAICCAKLHELGKSEPVESRGPYLGAAAACEAAPDAETALKRVTSNLRTSKSTVPPECE